MSYLSEVSPASLLAFLADLKTSSEPKSLLTALSRAHPSLLKTLKDRIFTAKDKDLNATACALEIARNLAASDLIWIEHIRKNWLSVSGSFDFVPTVVYPLVNGKMDVNVARLFAFMSEISKDPIVATFLFRGINWSLDSVTGVSRRRFARAEFLKFSLVLLKVLPEISDFVKTLLPGAIRLCTEISDVSGMSIFRENLMKRVIENPAVSRHAKQRLFDAGAMAALARCTHMADAVKSIIANDLLRSATAASEILKVAKFSFGPEIVKKFPALLEQAVMPLPACGLSLKYLAIGNFLTRLFRAAGRVVGITKAELTKGIGNPDACALVKVTGLRLLLATLEAKNLETAWLPDLSFVFAQHGVTEEICDAQLVALSVWAECVVAYKKYAPGSFRLFRADWSRKILEIADRTKSQRAKLVLAKLLAEISRGARITTSVADSVTWLFRLRRFFRKSRFEQGEEQLSVALRKFLIGFPFMSEEFADILVAKVKREEHISDLHAALTKIATDPLALIPSPAEAANIFPIATCGSCLAKYFEGVSIQGAEISSAVDVTLINPTQTAVIPSSNFRSPVPESLEEEIKLLHEAVDLRAFVDSHLSTLIFSLGSEKAAVRRKGGQALGMLLNRLRTEMETEEKRFAFKELPQIFWLLVMLRNSIQPPVDDETVVARQPLVRLSFATAASAVLLRSEHPAYKAVYRNVTTGERLSDLPLYDECMLSHSVEEAKTLRIWWLRWIARATECDLSARVFHRFRMMETAMTLAVANSTDRVAASLAISIVVGLIRGVSNEQREKLARKFGVVEWLAHVSRSKHVVDTNVSG